MVYLRQKEVPLNSVIAAAATGGFLSMRKDSAPPLAQLYFVRSFGSNKRSWDYA
jgi:hypothetical protein